MNVQAIVLPYYGIGDFLSNLTFINALLKKFPKDKFLIFTKDRTKAKELLSCENNIKIIYIKNRYNLISSFFNLFSFSRIIIKNKVSKIWIFHRSPRYALISYISGIRDIYGYGFGIQRFFLRNCKELNKKFKKSIPVEKGYFFLKNNNVSLKPLNPFLKIEKKKIKIIKNNFKKYPKKWILIGFSSTDLSRTWKKEYFVELINKLDSRSKYSFFLIGAPQEIKLANEIKKLIKIKKGKIVNFCKPIEETMALMSLSKIYIGNDSGTAHLSLACKLKTYIIHGGSPPYNKTVYNKNYPAIFLKNLNPIIPPDGKIRNPNLKTSESVTQEEGMDLIRPEYFLRKISKLN